MTKKYRFQYVVTVHDLKDVSCDSRPISISWKRGSKKGSTRKQIMATDAIIFDEQFTLSTLLTLSESGGLITLVPKYLELSLNQEYGLKEGHYSLGKITLDLSTIAAHGDIHQDLRFVTKSGSQNGIVTLTVTSKCLSEIYASELERIFKGTRGEHLSSKDKRSSRGSGRSESFIRRMDDDASDDGTQDDWADDDDDGTLAQAKAWKDMLYQLEEELHMASKEKEDAVNQAKVELREKVALLENELMAVQEKRTALQDKIQASTTELADFKLELANVCCENDELRNELHAYQNPLRRVPTPTGLTPLTPEKTERSGSLPGSKTPLSTSRSPSPGLASATGISSSPVSRKTPTAPADDTKKHLRGSLTRLSLRLKNAT
eukprot:TRINITY_DN4247_c0_g1::TRINITY_DN4247_c0_g1_i1::g.7913::m.7913 TRINITY_DN4247_c0_g1::TRINITY_DN4247_c0_g1_i1::g.7913  ORF type:complete len:398 (+),score=39.86,NT-C2/PF10358.4/1.6e-16,APG6/PF04111.7/2.2e+02,APG6/PF04111.7/0.00017,ERM/PF00769.14/0.0021,Macoilin/PF09726.4/0.0087,ATG16/PF08614.6/0.015,CENP-F_leu_zip/PF10473.4/0.2,Fzo_mitofusin/PF04799.8/0.18,IncA/PF04156.9/0.26,Spc7/PF08317.6/0.25,DUF972/PF06156.8/1e+03,DUF972/PF06156.8/0.83 TRINITY_DN4247_c0_g1_i1:64-1194(+)